MARSLAKAPWRRNLRARATRRCRVSPQPFPSFRRLPFALWTWRIIRYMTKVLEVQVHRTPSDAARARCLGGDSLQGTGPWRALMRRPSHVHRCQRHPALTWFLTALLLGAACSGVGAESPAYGGILTFVVPRRAAQLRRPSGEHLCPDSPDRALLQHLDPGQPA